MEQARGQPGGSLGRPSKSFTIVPASLFGPLASRCDVDMIVLYTNYM